MLLQLWQMVAFEKKGRLLSIKGHCYVECGPRTVYTGNMDWSRLGWVIGLFLGFVCVFTCVRVCARVLVHITEGLLSWKMRPSSRSLLLMNETFHRHWSLLDSIPSAVRYQLQYIYNPEYVSVCVFGRGHQISTEPKEFLTMYFTSFVQRLTTPEIFCLIIAQYTACN